MYKDRTKAILDDYLCFMKLYPPAESEPGFYMAAKNVYTLVEDLVTGIENLEATIAELRTKTSSLLSQENGYLKTALSERDSTIDKLVEERKAAYSNLDCSLQENRNLLTEVEHLKRMISNRDAMVDSMRKDNEDLRKEVAHLRTTVEERNNTIEHYWAKISNLESDRDLAVQASHKIFKDMERVKNTTSVFRDDLDKTQKELYDAQKEIESLTITNLAQTATINEKNKELEAIYSFKKASDEYDEQIAASKAGKVNETAVQLEGSRIRCSVLEEQVAQLRERITELQEMNCLLAQDFESQRNINRNCSTRISELLDKNGTLQRDFDYEKSIVNNLTEANVNLAQDLESQRALNRGCSEKISELFDEIKAVNLEYTYEKEKSKSLAEKLQEVQGQLGSQRVGMTLPNGMEAKGLLQELQRLATENKLFKDAIENMVEYGKGYLDENPVA